jgi:predicted transcriptional regulator
MPKTATVTVRMDQKTKDALTRAAGARRVSVSDLVVEGAHKQLEYEKWFRKKVLEGLKSIEEGRTLSSEQIIANARERYRRQTGRERQMKMAAE